MIRKHLVLSIAICFLLCANTAVSEGDWQPLFPSDSLDGWESIGPGEWSLEDGVLSVKGSKTKDVILLGSEDFGDFNLRFQYNLDSLMFGDIFFRGHHIQSGYYGYLCEIAPYAGSGTATSGLLRNLPGTGHLYSISGPGFGVQHRKRLAKSTLAGEYLTPGIKTWHRVEIHAASGQFNVTVNGQPATECKNNQYISGLVGFALRAGYPGEIRFKDIEIQTLPAEKGYHSLFNGKDLTGWKIHGQPQQWRVEDGIIKSESINGAYSYLATEKEYKNFSIIAEFLGLANGNSGLFFHSHLKGTDISGIQSEVQPPTDKRLGHSGCLYDSSGRGWLIDPKTLRPEQEGAFRMNEWNTMRVDVKDNHIVTWLNGLQIVDYRDPKPPHETGVIALQIHSGGGVKVNWRNIRIKELE